MPEKLWGQIDPSLPKDSLRSKVGRPSRTCALSPAVFFICFARAGPGRHSPEFGSPEPFIAITKNGRAWVFGSGSVKSRCGSALGNEASLGAGKRSVLTDTNGVTLGAHLPAPRRTRFQTPVGTSSVGH